MHHASHSAPGQARAHLPMPMTRSRRLAMLLTAGALLLTVVGGCAAVPLGESREEVLAQARQRLRDGRWEAAEQVLRPLVTRAPRDGEARVLLGQALIGQRRWLEGFTELRQGLTDLEPEARERVLAELLDALLRAGRGRPEERRYPGSVEASIGVGPGYRIEFSVFTLEKARIRPSGPGCREHRARTPSCI